jgi:hypothetical protein
MAVLTTIPSAWKNFVPYMPPGFYRAPQREMTPEVMKVAASWISKNVRANKPIGFREYVKIGGRTYFFQIEPHYHPPNGPVKPWGWHKGCSVMATPDPNANWVAIPPKKAPAKSKISGDLDGAISGDFSLKG